MDMPKVNDYIKEAESTLQNEPQYRHLLTELLECRKEALKCEYNTAKLEKVMHKLYIMDIGYIIEKLKENPRGELPRT